MSDDVRTRMARKRWALANAETFIDSLRLIRARLNTIDPEPSVAYTETWQGNQVTVHIVVKAEQFPTEVLDLMDRRDWEEATLQTSSSPNRLTLRDSISTRWRDQKDA